MRFGLLNSLFTREKLPARLRYEDARAALESHSLKMKHELAQRDDAPPETLYYLASDEDPEIRGLVASNSKTPVQADELLLTDPEDDVRAELARKISRLLPDLDKWETSQLRDRVVAMLEKLAQDELPRIRRLIAEEVKASPNIPKQLALRLARDVDILVAGPVLEYSPLLDDSDILEIIATTQVDGILAAISKRGHVGPRVSEAIVGSLDIPAISQLLANPKAEIRDDTLEKIVAQAESEEALHSALVYRPGLSLRAIRRICVFVSRSLLDELGERHHLDAETKAVLKKSIQERIDQDHSRSTMDTNFIREAYAQDKLGNEIVTNAANAQKKDAVVLALSLKADVNAKTVTKIIESKSAKGIASLCWKAGLSMRTALAVQMHVAKVPTEMRVLPRDGTHYPMMQQEMIWHLQYFGVKS